MNHRAIFSLDPAPRKNSASLASFPFIRRFFETVYIDCTDLAYTIETLKRSSQRCGVYAVIDFKKKYFFEGDPKTPFAAYAILYDFVDGFLVKSWSDIQDDIDPMIHQRLYNDEYRPIYLSVESPVMQDELDDILEYSFLSNIDGLQFDDRRSLSYADKKNNDILKLEATGVKTVGDIEESLAAGASCVVYQAPSFILKELFKVFCLGHKWWKTQKKKNR